MRIDPHDLLPYLSYFGGGIGLLSVFTGHGTVLVFGACLAFVGAFYNKVT